MNERERIQVKYIQVYRLWCYSKHLRFMVWRSKQAATFMAFIHRFICAFVLHFSDTSYLIFQYVCGSCSASECVVSRLYFARFCVVVFYIFPLASSSKHLVLFKIQRLCQGIHWHYARFPFILSLSLCLFFFLTSLSYRYISFGVSIFNILPTE